MKALLFHKFKNICIKTIFWTRNPNCLYLVTLGEKAIQSCEYHKVPRPRKWGFKGDVSQRFHLDPFLYNYCAVSRFLFNSNNSANLWELFYLSIFVGTKEGNIWVTKSRSPVPWGCGLVWSGLSDIGPFLHIEVFVYGTRNICDWQLLAKICKKAFPTSTIDSAVQILKYFSSIFYIFNMQNLACCGKTPGFQGLYIFEANCFVED